MDSQWPNNWQIAEFSGPTSSVLIWQIAPLFVILSLLLATLAFYALAPISQQIKPLADKHPRFFIGWQFVAGCVVGASIWAAHILLLLGVNLPMPALDAQIIGPLIVSCLDYFLLFYIICQPQNTPRYRHLWIIFNILGLLCIHVCNLVAIIDHHYFEIHLYRLTLSLGFIVLASVMTVSIQDHDRDHMAIKPALFSILSAVLIIIAFRMELGSIDLFINNTVLDAQQQSAKIISSLLITITLLLMNFFVFLAIFAHRKILEQASDLLQKQTMVDKLHDDQASLSKLAHYDTLTTLYNRHAFMDAFAARLNEARQAANKLAILFIDLDNFKRINDTLGHSAGDELLRIVSRRLRSVLRGHDLIGRIGGDEFCLVAPISSTAEAKVIATRILNKMQEPITLSGHLATTTISIGISLFPYDGDSQDQLIKNADTALYQSKGSGRNTLNFYSDYLQHKSHRELAIQKDLHTAITQSQLFLDYQPVVRLSDNRIIGLEALVRWQHPEKGILTPEHFINIAEFNGFVELVDMWVIRHICRDIKTLLHLQTPLRISMNCSALNINNDRFIADAEHILDEEKTDKKWFCFELSESVLYEHRHKAPVFLAKLNQSGIKLIVDDFGSGASSLLWLKTLPITELKLDRCLLLDPTNPNDHEIVAALIAMSHKLGWHVTAKGVELQEQITLLTRENCDFAQGYAFGKPMRFTEVLSRLQQH